MALFWVSVSNYETGKFVGVAIINQPTSAEAGDAAVKMTKDPHHMEAAIAPVPIGAAVPAAAIGRLMPREELEKYFPDLMTAKVNDAGEIKYEQPAT